MPAPSIKRNPEPRQNAFVRFESRRGPGRVGRLPFQITNRKRDFVPCYQRTKQIPLVGRRNYRDEQNPLAAHYACRGSSGPLGAGGRRSVWPRTAGATVGRRVTGSKYKLRIVITTAKKPEP